MHEKWEPLVRHSAAMLDGGATALCPESTATTRFAVLVSLVYCIFCGRLRASLVSCLIRFPDRACLTSGRCFSFSFYSFLPLSLLLSLSSSLLPRSFLLCLFPRATRSVRFHSFTPSTSLAFVLVSSTPPSPPWSPNCPPRLRPWPSAPTATRQTNRSPRHHGAAAAATTTRPTSLSPSLPTPVIRACCGIPRANGNGLRMYRPGRVLAMLHPSFRFDLYICPTSASIARE